MSVQTPDVNSHMTPEAKALEPSVQVSQGGGGSTPGEIVPPAKTEVASTQTSAQDASNFLIDSPVVEMVVSKSGFAARTSHDTAQPDADLILFRSLADCKDFDSLITLCRERLLTARDLPTSLRWSKDRALVEIVREDFEAAYDLLAGAHWMTENVTGCLRGRYENAFGLVLVEFGRTSLALGHFGKGLRHAQTAKVRADIEHNAGRAYAVQGNFRKAARYFMRSLDYARASSDYRLEGEICESLVEFGGAR